MYLKIYLTGTLEEIEIPEKITEISTECFGNCKGLKSVTLPDSVTKIGDSAFYNCTSLTYIEIPETVTCIRPYGFYNCTSLKLIIPESVKEIGVFAFWELPVIYYNGNASCSPWVENKYKNESSSDENWHAKERKTF